MLVQLVILMMIKSTLKRMVVARLIFRKTGIQIKISLT